MKQVRQGQPRLPARSTRPLAITLALAVCGLVVPTAAHAGVATPAVCPEPVTLSGGPSPTEQISVDDDLKLRLNGATIFDDANGFAGDLDPIGFEAAIGDQLRVTATNGVFGGPEHIDPLYLTCDANAAQQVLDDTGFDAPDGPIGDVFYDETFTVELGSPDTTITKHPKKKTKKSKAKFRFQAVPAAGATFECKLDKKQFKPCDSPHKKRVDPGKHGFKVRATVDGVVDLSPAKFRWKVRRD